MRGPPSLRRPPPVVRDSLVPYVTICAEVPMDLTTLCILPNYLQVQVLDSAALLGLIAEQVGPFYHMSCCKSWNFIAQRLLLDLQRPRFWQVILLPLPPRDSPMHAFR